MRAWSLQFLFTHCCVKWHSSAVVQEGLRRSRMHIWVIKICDSVLRHLTKSLIPQVVAIRLGRTVHETSQYLRMDYQQYGSRITLLEPGKCGVELIPQDLSNFKQESRDADGTNQKKTREPCVPLRLCYDTFVLLLLISITVIATIYISHIQKHVQRWNLNLSNS